MINPIKNKDNTTYSTKRNVFKNFQNSARLTQSGLSGFRDMRVKSKTRKLDVYEKAGVAAGSLAGTILPMVYFSRHQNRKMFNLHFGLKEMLVVGAGSILGGVLAGIAFDKSKNHKDKINEGVFQFFNASVPTLVYAGLAALQKKAGYGDNKLASIFNTALGLGVGMFIAAKTANLVVDPYDRKPDRKLTMKDALVNIDDALGVFALAKFPLIDKLHPEKILPAIYAWCGYRAGQSN